MSKTDIFKEITKEYEKTRAIKARELDSRKTEVYDKIPRVREIDGKLASIGAQVVRLALKDKSEATLKLKELRETDLKLNEEKQKLLKNAGYNAAYLKIWHDCELCGDTGFIGAERCCCLAQKIINRHYRLSNLQNRLQAENFNTFDINLYDTKKDVKTGISPKENMAGIHALCLSFVKNFDTVFNNLLFYGNTGLGKTFLCNCIAKELLDKGKTVLYVTAPQLFKLYEDIRFSKENTESKREYADTANNADLLIIDDLGAEFATVISASELFNIINTRILDKKHTVISTNLDPNSDFEDAYSQRIVSRFMGNYLMLEFTGTDIRLKKKYA